MKYGKEMQESNKSISSYILFFGIVYLFFIFVFNVKQASEPKQIVFTVVYLVLIAVYFRVKVEILKLKSFYHKLSVKFNSKWKAILLLYGPIPFIVAVIAFYPMFHDLIQANNGLYSYLLSGVVGVAVGIIILLEKLFGTESNKNTTAVIPKMSSSTLGNKFSGFIDVVAACVISSVLIYAKLTGSYIALSLIVVIAVFLLVKKFIFKL